VRGLDSEWVNGLVDESGRKLACGSGEEMALWLGTRMGHSSAPRSVEGRAHRSGGQ